MLAGERKIASDGFEVMLFPLEIMWMTQGIHQGYCMDFQGAKKNAQGNIVREYQCPLYAPCSCVCVARSSSGDWQVFNSLDKVHCADGVLRNVCFQIGHDNNPRQIGDRFTQGDLIGHTGTNGNVTGDHLHFNVAGQHYTAPWSSHLNGSIQIYNGCYVDDTILYDDGGYNWVTYGQTPPIPPTPTRKKEHKFPWWLYWKNFRNGIR